MTPFMWRVRELLDGGPGSSPNTEPSDEVSVAEGADTQVIIRSLAEQLVSEANAVLSWHGDSGSAGELTLVDETGPGALAFTLGFGPRHARIETVISGHSATASLVTADGVGAPRRLAGEDQVEDLVLELLAGN